MKITTYKEAQVYLESLIKPYQMEKIVGIPDQYNNPLGRMTYLLELLENPQKKFRSIVISGTSGKGSTTYAIAHMLTAAGYTIGFATSPHLKKINERMQLGINKKLSMISSKELITYLNKVIPIIKKMNNMTIGQPSYFEVLLAIGFLYFAEKKVDLAVVEVGLEGKYDGTQVLSPLIFVYTNTSLDHTHILGETIEEIVKEGLSSIENSSSANRPLVVSGVSQQSVQTIIEETCAKASVKLLLLGKDFSYTVEKETTKENVFTFTSKSISLPNIHCSLIGGYQMENVALAIETVLQLKKFGIFITEQVIREALQSTFFSGRFEKKGTIILDGAHNPAKMEAFITSLQKLYPHERKIFILGFKEDKNIDDMLTTIIPFAGEIITTEYAVLTDMKIKSAFPTYKLFHKIHVLAPSLPIIATETVSHAIVKAKKLAKKDTMIIITGSLYLVGEALSVL
jgi:dihydrofolate synthase/folylpolyglutamate synthase